MKPLLQDEKSIARRAREELENPGRTLRRAARAAIEAEKAGEAPGPVPKTWITRTLSEEIAMFPDVPVKTLAARVRQREQGLIRRAPNLLRQANRKLEREHPGQRYELNTLMLHWLLTDIITKDQWLYVNRVLRLDDVFPYSE